MQNVVRPTLVAMATKIWQIWATFSQKSILLFCLSMESSHFFGRQFSMWHSTKRCSSIFELGPLTPKIYAQNLHFHKITYYSACMTDTPEMFSPRGFSGMADSMEPRKMLWGRPLLPWQRNLGKFWLFFDKIGHESSCMP